MLARSCPALRIGLGAAALLARECKRAHAPQRMLRWLEGLHAWQRA